MSDKDPWAGVRDGKYHPAELDPEVDVYLAIDVEPLLVDADALLVVKITSGRYLLELDSSKPLAEKELTQRLEEYEQALAALPEHLKK